MIPFINKQEKDNVNDNIEDDYEVKYWEKDEDWEKKWDEREKKAEKYAKELGEKMGYPLSSNDYDRPEAPPFRKLSKEEAERKKQEDELYEIYDDEITTINKEILEMDPDHNSSPEELKRY